MVTLVLLDLIPRITFEFPTIFFNLIAIGFIARFFLGLIGLGVIPFRPDKYEGKNDAWVAVLLSLAWLSLFVYIIAFAF